MERVYTLIQPGPTTNTNTAVDRVVSAKIATIVDEFNPNLTFWLSVDINGIEINTNDLEQMKKIVAEDNWWNIADDGVFLRKCAQYESNFPSGKVLKASSLEKKDHINPRHYQECFSIPELVGFQWIEHIQYHHRFRDPEKFKTALELQARKYLDRLGGKDEDSQEIMKAVWYLKYLAAYIRNGNKPIRVEDVDKILSTPCA